MRSATVRQLARKIKGPDDADAQARFAFFLGAGASAQAGIPTAREMIGYFKDQIIKDHFDGPMSPKEIDEWLSSQEWYGAPGPEYSKLFEQFEPKEVGRQRYIERIIEGHRPSLGYIILANLMAARYVNSVITTNFDDLVYAACTTYTGTRPIVHAYGVLASEIRLTTERPKILKLHGDFLYSRLKNTSGELAVQDPNMARQTTQVLSEYGLVVVGYGGGDESVMNVIDGISEANDLYWCIQRGAEPSERVRSLVERKHGFFVVIDGFDEMMDEIRSVVGFDVQLMMGSALQSQEEIVERLKELVRDSSGQIRNNGIKILDEIVTALSEQVEQQGDLIRRNKALHHFVRGLDALQNSQFEIAVDEYRSVLSFTPDDPTARNNLGWALEHRPNGLPEAIEQYRAAVKLQPRIYMFENLVNGLISMGRVEDAIGVASEATKIFPQDVRAYALSTRAYFDSGRLTEAIQAARRTVEVDPRRAESHNQLGFALLANGNLEEAETELNVAGDLDAISFAIPINLGIVRALQGRMDEARALWKQGLDRISESDAWFQMNRIFYTGVLSDMPEAVEQMRKLTDARLFTASQIRDVLGDATLLLKAPNPPQGIDAMVSLLTTAATGAVP